MKPHHMMFIISPPFSYIKKKKSIDQDLLVQPAAVAGESIMDDNILNEGGKEVVVDLKTRRRHDIKMIGYVRR